MASRRKDRFGSWRLEAARSLLIHDRSGHEIDLLELNRPAQLLNCIYQVNATDWATEADLGALVQALGYVFDPKATMCSGGQDQRFSARDWLQQRLGSVRPRSR